MTATKLANSLEAIPRRVAAGRIGRGWPLAMVFARTLLFAAIQLAIAAIYALVGHAAPWEASAAWWPGTAFLGSVATLLILRRLARREGLRVSDFYNVDWSRWRRDLPVALGTMLIGGPIGFFPNLLLSRWLFGNSAAGGTLLYRPQPTAVLVLFLLTFPLAQALSELPTYFGYAMPRLQVIWKRPWAAYLLTSLFLGAQHIALPLVFDWRFIVWRLGMFLPFALFVGLVLKWRPTLLPYYMVVHGLMDISAVAGYWMFG